MLPNKQGLEAKQAQRRSRRRRILTSWGSCLLSLAFVFLIGIILILWINRPSITTSIFPSAISPNGDDQLDTVAINYRLTAPATIQITLHDKNGIQIQSILENTQQESGSYTLNWDGIDEHSQPVMDGNYSIISEASRFIFKTSSVESLIIDTQPPKIELLNVDDGAQVRQQIISIEGRTEAGVAIQQIPDSRMIASGPDGFFSIQVMLSPGTNVLELKAVDGAGNTAVVQRGITLIPETTEINVQEPVDQAWFNEPMIHLRGSVTVGNILRLNGEIVQSKSDGSFDHGYRLIEGENILHFESQSPDGQNSSLERTVWLRTIPPHLVINLAEGQTISSPEIELSGNTEPAAAVTVNDRLIPVSASGEFQTQINLSPGENNITITTRDRAGNQTTIRRKLLYTPGGLDTFIPRISIESYKLDRLILPAVLLIICAAFLYFYLRRRSIRLDASIDQQLFTPWIPGERQVLTITIDLDHQARLSVEIVDIYHRTVNTIVSNRRKSARRHHFSWDGRSDRGDMVPPGQYIIRATASLFPASSTQAIPVQLDDRKTELVTTESTNYQDAPEETEHHNSG